MITCQYPRHFSSHDMKKTFIESLSENTKFFQDLTMFKARMI